MMKQEAILEKMADFLSGWYECVDPRVVAPLRSGTLVDDDGTTWGDLVEAFLKSHADPLDECLCGHDREDHGAACRRNASSGYMCSCDGFRKATSLL